MLHRMPSLVAGHANGGSRGVVIDLIRQADDIGLGIVVIRQVAGDMLNPDGSEAVGIQNPASSLGAGDAPAGILGGVAAEGAVHIGAGPHGQKYRRQHQDDIGPVKKQGGIPPLL